jgi:hypothetical protein
VRSFGISNDCRKGWIRSCDNGNTSPTSQFSSCAVVSIWTAAIFAALDLSAFFSLLASDLDCGDFRRFRFFLLSHGRLDRRDEEEREDESGENRRSPEQEKESGENRRNPDPKQTAQLQNAPAMEKGRSLVGASGSAHSLRSRLGLW